MGLYLFWQEHSTAVIISVLTAIVVALLKDMILALLKLVYNHGKMLLANLNARLLSRRFENRYLKYLCEKQRFLNVRGIRSPSQVGVELEKVYISLKLRGPPRYGENIRSRADIISREKLSSTLQGEPDLFPATVDREAERLSIGDALRSYSNRLVILGGPGTGKTTLLSYLALKFGRGQAKEGLGLDEKRLPILIPLRELARRKTSLTAENLASLCVARELASESPKDFFKKRLQNGQCIVLLDGMDEVIAEEENYQVAGQIDDFVSTYPNNRFIVTSRPTGHGSTALAGFTQLEICNLGDADVEAFAHHWCLAVEMATRGAEVGASEGVARQEAERAAKELVSAIRANDRVRCLTVNPLLLTIVAMVHRYRATLPNRRVELYNECTEVLLGHWDEVKGIVGRLNWARKRRVLERLAYRMHTQRLREAGMAQIEKIVAEVLPTVGEREASATEFLMNVRDRSGLLMEVEADVFGFAHLTFQEYLTANYLIDQREKGLEELIAYLQDPWWHEVALLYSARLSNATPVIGAILDQRDDIFRSNLFLAANCLVDVVSIDPGVEDRVLSQLMAEFFAGEFKGRRDRAKEALLELGHGPSAPKVVEHLARMLEDDNASIRMRAASALKQLGEAYPLGEAKPRVIEALRKMLGDENERVRRSAAYAISVFKKTEPRVVEALLKMLEDENKNVRENAAYALGVLGEAEPWIIEALLNRLNDTRVIVRESAANALGILGKAEPKVVEALQKMFEDENKRVRNSAASALAMLGDIEPRVADALFGQLNDTRAIVRESAAYAFSQIPATEWGEARQKVIDTLLKMLREENVSVRRRATAALGMLVEAEPRVIEALLKMFRDDDSHVRESAVYAMGLYGDANQLGETKPRVVGALLEMLGDVNSAVRNKVTYALSMLAVSHLSGEVEPWIIEALSNRLNDTRVIVRVNAACTLGRLKGGAYQLGETEPRVVEALLKMLEDKNEGARRIASYALGRLWGVSEAGEAKPMVAEALLKMLADENKDVRSYAAYALSLLWGAHRLGKTEPMVAEALLKMLGDENEDVRGSAAFALIPRLIDIDGTPPIVTPQNIPYLKQLLSDDRMTGYPFYKHSRLSFRFRIKDVAWEMLRRYSYATGERIYRDDRTKSG